MTMMKSAQSHRQKISSLAQEAVRHMRNTGRNIGKERRTEIMIDMKEKLRRSGYNDSTSNNIIDSGLRGYYTLVENEIKGGRKVNRPQREDRNMREMNKVTEKSDWHLRKDKQKSSTTPGVGVKPNNTTGKTPRRKVGTPLFKTKTTNTTDHTKNVESIIFIPHTPNSELLRRLQQIEDQFCKLNNTPKWKFTEMGGPKIKDMLANYTPWETQKCHEELKCWPCQSQTKDKGKLDCRATNCTYKITCITCEEESNSSEYIGETSRSLYYRALEHQKANLKMKEDSPMWTHRLERHNGEESEFKIELIKTHKSAFNRQISEGVWIEQNKSKFPMNRKGEFNGHRIPKLATEVNGYIDGLKRTNSDRITPEKPIKRPKIEEAHQHQPRNVTDNSKSSVKKWEHESKLMKPIEGTDKKMMDNSKSSVTKNYYKIFTSNKSQDTPKETSNNTRDDRHMKPTDPPPPPNQDQWK